MKKQKLILASLLITTLVGCANIQSSQTAAKAKKNLVGMSKESILQCMGAASNIQSVGNTEVWEYSSIGSPHTTINYYNNQSGYNQYGYGNVNTIQRNCKINVVFIGGQVSSINYSGNTGGLFTKDYQCAETVKNCVR